MKLAYQPYELSKKQIKALKDSVIVKDMKFTERKIGSIIVPADDGKDVGIRPRWAEVYAVGPDQEDVKVGEYVLIAHGRWTRGIDIEDEQGTTTIRKIDPNDILLVSDEPRYDETMSNKV